MAESRTAARLRRLVAELGDELPALAQTGAAVEDAASRADQTPDDAHVALLAVRLHAYYTGLESILSRIERTLGSEPTCSSASRTTPSSPWRG